MRFMAVHSPASPDWDYPPARTGMRGSGYPSAFAVGHALRDGTFWPHAADAIDTREEYDLVIVGAGISGLSAAHFYREAQGAGMRILILDNHDDFGGHAKRTQFSHQGDLRISNAGTFWIEESYGTVASHLLAELGIDPAKYQRENTNPRFYSSLGMGQGVFFDRETFGKDRLLQDPAPWTDFMALYEPNTPPNQTELWRRFMAEAPLSDRVKKDLYRLYNESHDYLAGMTIDEKIAKLKATSYGDFITQIAGCDPMVLTYLRDRVFGSGGGLDQYSAYRASGFRHLPGLYGMGLPPYELAGPFAHFPDGNATVARLLVRQLIPAALPGNSLDDSILAKVDYAALDSPDARVRIRLNSTAVSVRNVRSPRFVLDGFGEPGADGDEVAVCYAVGDKLYRVRARHCILACWNYVIRYICPDLPQPQKEALSHNVKVPNLWVNVWLRNWRAFHRARVNFINAPNSYYASLILQAPISIGGYSHSKTPDDPTVLTMLRAFIHPGLPVSQQHRLGRLDMYSTSLETFERNAHQQLDRILGPHGFNSASDILGITVNRWGHGYTWWEPTDDPNDVPYHIRGRQPFGRISIANTDAAGEDSTQRAIEQAYRAVHEVMLL
jgi:spermidine dehydrogenase